MLNQKANLNLGSHINHEFILYLFQKLSSGLQEVKSALKDINKPIFLVSIKKKKHVYYLQDYLKCYKNRKKIT